MLSRTADHIYWMSRYIERAESLARLVDAHHQMSLLPHSSEALTQSLSSTMTALRMEEAYRGRHQSIEAAAVLQFVSLDRDYHGSIFSCLRAARENARAVRGSLTSELWETLNSTWLELRSLAVRRSPSADIGYFVEWVKERSHLTRGVIVGTMMRDEAFHFSRIGTFLERADGTARILTAHQADMIPGGPGIVSDPLKWSVLLRALSAFEVYRRAYRDVVTPLKVAHLLIMREDMPRSLLRCCHEVYQNLKSVANEHSAETVRRAGEVHALLHFSRMESITAGGLPKFFDDFLVRMLDLGRRIASDFLLPPAEA